MIKVSILSFRRLKEVARYFWKETGKPENIAEYLGTSGNVTIPLRFDSLSWHPIDLPKAG